MRKSKDRRRSRPPARALWGLAGLTGLVAAALLAWPRLDLTLMARIYDPTGGFLLRGHPLSHAYDELRAVLFPAIVLIILGAGGAALARRPLPGLPGRRVLALLATLLVMVGGVQNLVFKEGFGRPRPKNTAVYGGELPYHPPLRPGGACAGNCSFVSGDVGFATLVLGLALGVPGGRRRRAALAGAGAFVLLVATERVLSGSHYPSDALVAALLTAAMLLGLERWLVAPRPPD